MSFFDPVCQGSRRGNAGKAHSWGIEVENSGTLTDRLGVQLAGRYLNATLDGNKSADATYQFSCYVSELNRRQDRSLNQVYMNSPIACKTSNPQIDVAVSVRNVLNTSKQVASV